MEEIGVVFGRFQILHLGYMEYILAAKMRCRKLIIGIGNPDMEHLQFNRSQEGCMRQKLNPFTYYERMEMIKGAMEDFGIAREAYDIVPFPLEDPPVLPSYVPKNAVYYMNVMDEWSGEKRSMLENMGFRVEILRFGEASEKKAHSSDVIESMSKNHKWDQSVPKTVAAYIRENNLDDRVRGLWKDGKKKLNAAEKAALDEIPPFVDKQPTEAEILGTADMDSSEKAEHTEEKKQKDLNFIF